ncbi:hypothetical protein PAECIP111893_00175 [Paenibacillus plantiphilus]|uniref:rRNA methylase n=1 Tax=Paenibacillus plantiphilus TaxID=2905650 RepID=A0ABN8FPY3_9BACL|nr:class I SAM-dependent methyltransferase [Paenibacillus plantiphilus]CAH1190100.1 hypothetical protein PAECIP111893_00175 [Paenibacillus plantiphilus]
MGFLSVLSMAHKLIVERVSPGDTVVDATCGNGVDTRFLAELVGARGTVYAFDIQAQALQRTSERLAPLAAAGKLPLLHLVQDSHAAMAAYVAMPPQGVMAAMVAPPAASGSRLMGPRLVGPAGAEAARLAESLAAESLSWAAAGDVAAANGSRAEYAAAQHSSKAAAVMFNLGYLPGADADPAVITKTDSTLAALDAALTLLRPGGIITIVVYPGHVGGELEAASVENWASALPQLTAQAVLYRMAQKPDSPYLIAVEKK